MFPWPKERPDVAPSSAGWFREENQAILGARCFPGIRLIAEVGVWFGQSARFLADEAPEATVLCIDTWLGSVEHHLEEQYHSQLPKLYETFLASSWRLRDRLVPMRIDALNGLHLIHRLGLHPQLIYVDAGHDSEGVRSTVATALSLFPDSVIVGDDWDWKSVRDGVLAAVPPDTLKHLNTVWWKAQ